MWDEERRNKIKEWEGKNVNLFIAGLRRHCAVQTSQICCYNYLTLNSFSTPDAGI